MPDPDAGIFPFAEISRFADLGAAEGFHRSPGRRDLLLTRIDASFKLTLTEFKVPRDQVLSDLIVLNFHPRRLQAYLATACWLTNAPPWAAALAKVEARLDPRSATRRGMARSEPPRREPRRESVYRTGISRSDAASPPMQQGKYRLTPAERELDPERAKVPVLREWLARQWGHDDVSDYAQGE